MHLYSCIERNTADAGSSTASIKIRNVIASLVTILLRNKVSEDGEQEVKV